MTSFNALYKSSKQHLAKSRQATLGACHFCKIGQHDRCRLPACSCCGGEPVAKVDNTELRAALVTEALPKSKDKAHALRWDYQTRVEMYSELTRLFGPHYRWTAKRSRMPAPNGTELGLRFLAWCRDFGKRMCERQGIPVTDKADAVRQQIAWALTTQKAANLRNSLRNIMAQNVLAAIDGGLLRKE